MSLPAHLKDLCDKKKASQQAALPRAYLLPETTSSNVMDVDLSGVLSEKERQITELKDVSALLAKLRSGEWTSEEVSLAFIKRATVAQQLTNCLTEFWFDEALQTARDLDARREKGEPLGHLHGLPVSLKDQLDVAGKELNMGYASWLGRISKEDAALVTVLKRAGAVLYARTNVPQTLMIGETVNYVYGRTTNPYNREHTSGGSSGGEGALIAFGGSPLGVGSDIGGSIRVSDCQFFLLGPSI
jgi:amidase